MLNCQYLYKKDSWKKVAKSVRRPELGDHYYDIYEVKAIQIHNYNIDSKGSALIENFIMQIAYRNKQHVLYGDGVDEHTSTRQSRFVIISYSKLEELMLSSDWIMIDSTRGIKEKMKTCTHAKKEV